VYVHRAIHCVVSFADSTQRYRNVYFHKRWYHYTSLSAFHTTHMNKETKNTWARDDPAILILMAGGMFGEILRAPDSVSFNTSHTCSRRLGLVRGLVLWPLRRNATCVSHGVPGFTSCGSCIGHLVVVRFILQSSDPPLTNLTGSSQIVSSFLLLLTQRRRIPLSNGPMLLMFISTRSSHFILPSILPNFYSSLSS
jgi:hypothetical protein